jgi:prevent-host-death family protein
MTIASVADVKAKLSAYLKASKKGPVVITRNGKVVAAIIPLPEDEDLERLMLSHSPNLRAILSEGHQLIASGQGTSHDRFWREVDADHRRKPRRKRA